jgi:aryl-alcohol dehydrogenase-like predicted oxidoreductase
MSNTRPALPAALTPGILPPMKYRRFGRLGWQVSEMGYGMWGMGGWTGSDDEQSLASLSRAVALGCNFFDTAWVYGNGHSEKLLGQTVRAHKDRRLYTASKIPPKDGKWPASLGVPASAVYPADHIRAYLERTLTNLGLDSVDLMQLHVWDDAWAGDEGWQRALDDARREGLIKGIGISINRWEPANALRALETGVVDAVQVIYNIFDQNPEDQLFPACRERDVAVIARVPFDEGTLTGKLTLDTTFPAGDWRNSYFNKENLPASVERAEKLRPLVPAGSTMSDLALRFILANDAVSTIIPGMRKTEHVEANIAASDAPPLSKELLAELRPHRWVRTRTRWSG